MVEQVLKLVVLHALVQSLVALTSRQLQLSVGEVAKIASVQPLARFGGYVRSANLNFPYRLTGFQPVH